MTWLKGYVGGSGGGDTQAPSVPAGLTAPSTTRVRSRSRGRASTDNVGVTGYQILRAPGASGGTFAQIGTSTTDIVRQHRSHGEHHVPLPGARSRRGGQCVGGVEHGHRDDADGWRWRYAAADRARESDRAVDNDELDLAGVDAHRPTTWA